MVLPKVIYETLPVVYLGTAVATLTMNDTAIRFLPVLLLLMVSVMVAFMRFNSRRHESVYQHHRGKVLKQRQNLFKSQRRSH